MRHSQGDRWDLLLLFPMGSFGEYYAPDRIARREKARAAAASDLAKLADDIAWQEDVFVFGPPLAEVRGQLGPAGFFHVEMFEALAGKRGELYRQREMENDYSKRLGLPQNLIFVRDCGAPVGPVHDRRIPRFEALRRERGHPGRRNRRRRPGPRDSTDRRGSVRTYER